MANELSELTLREVSLVDKPANSEMGIPRARVALFKRGNSEDFNENDSVCKAVFGLVDKDGKTYSGVTYPKSDFAYTPTDTPSDWKLRLTNTPGGAPDAGIVGAAVAALGKGFRGKKVQIPAAALAAVKAKVRAAWKKANPEKGSDELPDVLKGESTMTIQEIEKRLGDQDGIITTLKADNDALKAENETVIKMSKKERKLYASMPTDKRKAYMAADDMKRKAMLDECAQQKKDKAAEDSMDEATKAEFAKAGPSLRTMMLADANKKLIAKAKKMKGKDDEDPDADGDDDTGHGTGHMDNNEDEDTVTDKKKSKKEKAVAMKMASHDDELSVVKRELEDIRKQARVAHFIKRAEDELPNTSGSPAQKGEILMKMADSCGGENSESFKLVFKTMKDADEVVKRSFTERGKPGGPIPAEAAFMAKVDEIAKRDSIDKPHAVEKAMMENAELYMEYERGQGAAVVKARGY